MTGDLLARWMRFTTAGTAGFAIQLAALALLTKVAGMHYLAATAIAVEPAILSNYWWHERRTWRDRPAMHARDRWTRHLRFNALTAITSIAGSVVLTALFVEAAGLSPLAANMASVIAPGMLNFAGANSLVVRSAAVVALVSLATAAAADTMEATLQAKAAKDFARYVAAVEAQFDRELHENGPFLDIERQPSAQPARTLAAPRRREVVVTRGVARADRSPQGREESVEKVPNDCRRQGALKSA